MLRPLEQDPPRQQVPPNPADIAKRQPLEPPAVVADEHRAVRHEHRAKAEPLAHAKQRRRSQGRNQRLPKLRERLIPQLRREQGREPEHEQPREEQPEDRPALDVLLLVPPHDRLAHPQLTSELEGHGAGRLGGARSQAPTLARRLGRRLGLAVLGQLGAWFGAREVLTVGLFHGSLQPKLLVVLRSLADADRDGHSALVGGGDCDDFDPARKPAQCEVQDNGVDDNCNGIDETQATPLERPVATSGVPRQAAPDVVFIIVDTLRADYGGQPRPPAFAALAATSLDFAVAYTPYPSTHHALTAVAQGRYWRYTDPGHPGLGTLLRDAGYDQHMWHGTRRVDLEPAAPLFTDDEATREHLRMDKQRKDEHTAAVIDDMVRALSEAELPTRPQLWWLHLDDPHYPWVRGEPSEPNLARYRREVDHVDAQLARLWAALESSPRGRAAVVILIGDHGEEFGEHGGELHGGTLYEEGTRVPMMLRLPGVEPRAIAATASLLDVLPTLVHYLGLPDPGTLQGHDWLASATPPARVLAEIERAPGTLSVAHRATLQMVRDGSIKLIADLDRNAVLVFDLDADPGERRSIAHARRELARALLDRLARWQDAPGCRPPAVE